MPKYVIAPDIYPIITFNSLFSYEYFLQMIQGMKHNHVQIMKVKDINVYQ